MRLYRGRPKFVFYFLSLIAAIFISFCASQAAQAANPPIISTGTGGSTFQNQTSFTITGDSGANFFLTLDGTTPTPSSTPYSGEMTVPNYTTVKAIEVLSGVSSSVTTAFIQYEVPRPNLQLWLKPENIIASGSSVTGYTDVSGYSTTVTQSTTSNQPTLVSNALNGFSSASFNGSTTYLNIASGSTNAPFLSNLTGGVAIFAVVSPLTSTADKALFTASHTGVTDMTALQTDGTEVVFNVNKSTTAKNITSSTGAITVGTFQEVDAVLNQTNVGQIDVNGITLKTATLQAMNNTTRPVAYIGANDALLSTAFWGGQLVELLVYSTGTNFQTEAAQVQAYLAYRYQLGTSQTTPAPTISVPTSTLTGPSQVAISSAPNAVTYFTQTGIAPTTSSPVYTKPININFSQQLQAISVVNGIQSAVSSATYTLNATQWPAPSSTDNTSLQMNLQLPTTAIPQ